MEDKTTQVSIPLPAESSSDLARDSRDSGTETSTEKAPTRREFMSCAATAGMGLAIAPLLVSDRAPASGLESEGVVKPAALQTLPGSREVTLHVNGAEHRLVIEPRVTLLDALRERIKLTGTKKGCDHGQCGACTVLIDGRRTLSCLTLAIMHQGAKITTIEGLAQGEKLHPLQTAFIRHDAFQCGYCTPGQIMSAAGLVHEGRAHTEEEIQEQMSGNICRCGAYANIVSAVREVLEGRHASV
jgi:xanthine dehydrogenase YagT iron-sulfur-binding subunit